MARNIQDRLSGLSSRRKGVDSISKARITVHAQDELLAKSLTEEKWQKRATTQPYTRYALGAMQAVDAAYTQKSKDEAERVAQQLRSGLSVSVETRLQGSVPLDVHIRGVSDVDLLVLDTSFYTYDVLGAKAQLGGYIYPSSKTSLGVLQALRSEAETLLKTRFWGAKVDCTGSKCIALSGGSLVRPVDVVPSHWHDTPAYQRSFAEADRGVTILDKSVPAPRENLPFTHIARIHQRDVEVYGGLKKAIRLIKNLKSDAEHQILVNKLPSFDIAGLLYHADQTALRAGFINELYILREAQRLFDWCYANKAAAQRLRTPDDTRYVLDSEDKFMGVQSLSVELDDLAREVAIEQGLLAGATTNWQDIYRVLGEARIPDAA